MFFFFVYLTTENLVFHAVKLVLDTKFRYYLTEKDGYHYFETKLDAFFTSFIEGYAKPYQFDINDRS